MSNTTADKTNTEKTAELLMSMSLNFLQGGITEQTYVMNLEMIVKTLKIADVSK